MYAKMLKILLIIKEVKVIEILICLPKDKKQTSAFLKRMHQLPMNNGTPKIKLVVLQKSSIAGNVI